MSNDFKQGQMVKSRNGGRIILAILNEELSMISYNGYPLPNADPVGKISNYFIRQSEYEVIKPDINDIKKILMRLSDIQKYIGKNETKKFLIALIINMKGKSDESKGVRDIPF